MRARLRLSFARYRVARFALPNRKAFSQLSEIQGVLSPGRTAHPVFIPDSLTYSVSRK